jgi:hypothetical protein
MSDPKRSFQEAEAAADARLPAHLRATWREEATWAAATPAERALIETRRRAHEENLQALEESLEEERVTRGQEEEEEGEEEEEAPRGVQREGASARCVCFFV